MLWFNGEPLPVPAAPIQYTYRDIEGANSGQTLGGSYSKKVIAHKEDILITWQALSPDEAAQIAKLRNSIYGRLTYYSPAAGGFITNNVYIESHTHELTDAQLTDGALYGSLNALVQFRQR